MLNSIDKGFWLGMCYDCHFFLRNVVHLSVELYFLLSIYYYVGVIFYGYLICCSHGILFLCPQLNAICLNFTIYLFIVRMEIM